VPLWHVARRYLRVLRILSSATQEEEEGVEESDGTKETALALPQNLGQPPTVLLSTRYLTQLKESYDLRIRSTRNEIGMAIQEMGDSSGI
jgi:hypothetical protein